MKRDMDLIRDILLYIEKSSDPDGVSGIEISGYNSHEITYHVNLLIQAGLITADVQTFSGGHIRISFAQLTWPGHEFLNATRDNTVWKKVKGEISEKGGSFTFDIVKALATEILSGRLNLG